MNYEQAIEFIQSFPDAERGLPGAKPSRSLKMPLSTMKALLQALDNPQDGVPTVHITGSKGKGSTATFVASILKEAGLRTALFTSPHIHSYQERIAFDLQPVDANTFAQGIADLKLLIEKFDQNGSTISTFGILTVLFFQLVKQTNSYRDTYFNERSRDKQHQKIDWQIIEVGLGGADDVTNVFEQKEVVVITPISLEHTAILGSTKSAIAKNKAGIITPGCMVVLAPQSEADVVKIIREICAQKDAQLIEVAECYQSLEHRPNSANQEFAVLRRSRFQQVEKSSYRIQLLGEHQISNAITALAVIEGLVKRKKLVVSEQAGQNGLAKAFLPGRFEIIRADKSRPYASSHDVASNRHSVRTAYPEESTAAREEPAAVRGESTAAGEEPVGVDAIDPFLDQRIGPFPDQRADKSRPYNNPFTFVLDGAHNGDSAEALAKTLHQVFPERQIILIIGVNQDKDLESIWLALKNTVTAVIATQSDNYRALSPGEIRDRTQMCDNSVEVLLAGNIDEALKIATDKANEISRQEKISSKSGAVICVCGSLYLVAEARAKLLRI